MFSSNNTFIKTNYKFFYDDYMFGYSSPLDAYREQYDGMIFDEALKKGYDHDSILININKYKVCIFDQYGITIEEKIYVKTYSYSYSIGY